MLIPVVLIEPIRMIMSSCRLSRPFSKEERGRGFISRTSVGNRYFTEVELSISINVKKKKPAQKSSDLFKKEMSLTLHLLPENVSLERRTPH